jgi:integrase
LIEQCAARITAYGRHETLLTGEGEGQLSAWAIERAMRKARSEVKNLPAGFRYHDLRHYFASLLIADGADVKTVQARLRHASAKTGRVRPSHVEVQLELPRVVPVPAGMPPDLLFQCSLVRVVCRC